MKFIAYMAILIAGTMPAAAQSLCDKPQTIDALTRLTNKRLSESAQVMLGPGIDYYIFRQAADRNAVDVRLSAIRDRGPIGAKGAECAALARISTAESRRTYDLQAIYTVEPSLDGNVVVTARFSMN